LKLDDLLQRLKIKFVREGHHHSRAGWIQTDCPFCGRDSNKFHLGWNLESNYVHCWRCGHHKLNQTLVELTNISFVEINELIKSLTKSTNVIQHDPRGEVKIPNGVGDLQKQHRKYLQKRRYDPDEIAETWSVGGIGIHQNLSWRIFIPIIYQHETVSWTTRSVSDQVRVRYMSASANQEAMNHKQLLYGEDFCNHAVIVHEGAFDVWRTGKGAVATCGTGFTRSQVLKLSNYPIRVICFDNEPEAQQRADELCSLLEPFQGETYNVQLSSKDASEAPANEIKELRGFLK